MNISAGIVTFNPDIKVLEMNVRSIISQLKFIIIVDNGSNNYGEIQELFRDNIKVILIPNTTNQGIAKALNQIMEYSNKKGIEWVLTLDQDTISPKNVIKEYQKYIHCDNVAIITSQIRDVNIDRMLTDKGYEKVTIVQRCITSGALTNVKAWESISGFNNELFIDYVDFDFSTRLIIKGYKIYRVNEVCFEHSLGDSQLRRFLFINVRISNHNSFRKYFIARNMIYYIKKYKKHIDMKKEYLRFLKVVFLTIFYEKSRKEKVSSIIKGIKDSKMLV